MEKNNYNLAQILTEGLDARGLTIKRLSELTAIPERYLLALRDNDAEQLPPAPYIRGYLLKIAEVLNIDGRMLWESHKNQLSLKSSGTADRLPANRFALKKIKKTYLYLGIAALIVIIYAGWRGPNLFGKPELEITNPAAPNVVTRESSMRLSGTINPQDKLTINNEEVIPDGKGRFEKDFALEPGMNTVEFKVKRFLGKETKMIRQIIYQP